jgi:hypothetical protein
MSDDPCADADIPIACTLDVGTLTERLAEWQAFATASVRRVERHATSARMLLAAGDHVLVAAASLAQREKQCCAFFDFTVVLESEERWLTVSVPARAADTLSSFVEMLAAEA